MLVSLVLRSLFGFKKLMERKKERVVISDRNIHQKNIDAGEKPLVIYLVG